MTEKFYRDIAALKESSLALAESNAADLTSWIIDQLRPRRGDAILEIGCSNGKRTLPLARIVGETGYVLAIDRSYEALSTLSLQSLEESLETQIRFLQINLDSFGGHVRANAFDRVLGSHSLSRIKHPRTAFNTIQRALKPDGTFFFYGPTRKDHAELRDFHADLCGERSAYETLEPTFMEGVGMQYVRDFFSDLEIVKFEQPLRLTSTEALHACWSVSKLYNEQLEQRFIQAAKHHFASQQVFETIHRVMGIKVVK
jgi:SAM-dependent methyltransferase